MARPAAVVASSGWHKLEAHLGGVALGSNADGGAAAVAPLQAHRQHRAQVAGTATDRCTGSTGSTSSAPHLAALAAGASLCAAAAC